MTLKPIDRLVSTKLWPSISIFCRIRNFRHHSSQRNRLRTAIAPRAQGMQSDLWALDFDGVVCNSVGESSKSAWQVN